MKKYSVAILLLAALCLLLVLPAAGETREAVIALEGEDEPIEETLFESPLGFSFWYVSDRFEAYHGEADNIDGVIVTSLYSDDYMVLSMIPEEDAEEYAEYLDESITDISGDSRVMLDVYRELSDGRYYFLTLIAENGQYFRAVGEYAEEAAEGNAKFFDKVLNSVAFTSGCPIRAAWGESEPDGSGEAQVILTATEPVADVTLLSLDWDGTKLTWTPSAPLGSFTAQQKVTLTLTFIGDMPEHGLMYTDEAGTVHAYALDISGEDGHLILWELEE